jgi:hypothetical protein
MIWATVAILVSVVMSFMLGVEYERRKAIEQAMRLVTDLAYRERFFARFEARLKELDDRDSEDP